MTRNPAVARIADRTGCQRPLRLSKVDNFFMLLSQYATSYQWPISTYRGLYLAPFSHSTSVTDRQTDDNHDNNSTFT